MAVVVVTLLTLVAAGAFVQLGKSSEGTEQYDLYSTLSPAPDGTRAIHELLTDLGYETRRQLDDFARGDLQDVSVVVMLQPIRPLESAEEDLLMDWMQQEGGTLFLAGQMTSGSALVNRPREGLSDPLAYHHPDLGNLPKQEGVEDWTEDESGDEAWLIEGVEELVWVPILMSEQRVLEVDPAASFQRRADHTVLVTRKQSSFLEVSRVGRGRVVKVASVDLFINDNVARGSNLRLLLNSVSDASVVLFDEAHRRMTPGEQGSVWDVLGPASELAFLQLLLAIAAALVALGWRSAPAMQEAPGKRRRALEQVEALAAMLQRAAAADLAISLMHGRTRRLWSAGRFQTPTRRSSPTETQRRKRLFDELERLASRRGGPPAAATKRLSMYMKLYGELRRREVHT